MSLYVGTSKTSTDKQILKSDIFLPVRRVHLSHKTCTPRPLYAYCLEAKNVFPFQILRYNFKKSISVQVTCLLLLPPINTLFLILVYIAKNKNNVHLLAVVYEVPFLFVGSVFYSVGTQLFHFKVLVPVFDKYILRVKFRVLDKISINRFQSVF